MLDGVRIVILKFWALSLILYPMPDSNGSSLHISCWGISGDDYVSRASGIAWFLPTYATCIAPLNCRDTLYIRMASTVLMTSPVL